MPDSQVPEPSEPTAAPPAGAAGDIVCRTSRWYFNRMGLMFLMLIGFAGWFLYDGLVKYPKQIEVYDEYQTYKEREDAYDRFEAGGRLAEWPAYAAEQGWPDDEPPRWSDYALANNLDEEPDERDAGDVKEQLAIAGVTSLLALVVAGFYFVNRSKTLRADEGSFTTPDGKRVPFDSVFRIDKRKWKYKGLAYTHYREAEGSPAKRAVIDDLKFDGAHAVLDRLLGQFEGELVDRVEPGEEADDPPGEEGADPREKS